MLKLIIEKKYYKYEKKIKYAFSILKELMSLEIEDDVLILYGLNELSECDIHIVPFNQNYDVKAKKNNNLSIIKEDILYKTFRLITCDIENTSGMDKHDRRIRNSNFEELQKKPSINRYALYLKDKIMKICEHKNIKYKLIEKKFVAVLTHDVDNFRDRNIYILAHRVNTVLKYIKNKKINQGLKYLLKSIIRIIKKRDYYNNVYEYMEMESKYGFKSSFYFMTGERGRYGARYNINTERIQKIIKDVDLRGNEVGLHLNYNSFLNLNRIIFEKKQLESVLGKKIIGTRSHYLRFRIPDTWELLKSAGFKYDTTIGFSDISGFRAGIAEGYYPYYTEKDQMINIVEIPMTIMDGTIINQNISYEKNWNNIKKILDQVKKVNGTIGINFHNRVLDEEYFIYYKELYQEILKYIYKNNGVGISGIDYIEKYDKRIGGIYAK